jgi:ribosomal-protein-alanine N-acetyltransferase
VTPVDALDGELVRIRPLRPSDARALLELRVRNRAFFSPYEPTLSDQHFTLDGQLEDIEQAQEDARRGRRHVFGIFTRAYDELVGRIALANVARGAWQNATLGYYIDEAYQGRGYATDAVRLAVRYAFDVAGLHRVQAGVLVDNARSARVLEKAGFRWEGTSLRYLCINGRWRDHLMFAVTREEWPPQT